MADASFRITMLAACNANEFLIPPLFIVPGMILSRNVMDACEVTTITMKNAPKGFMNSGVFTKWLVFFGESVHRTVNRPIMTVYYQT